MENNNDLINSNSEKMSGGGQLIQVISAFSGWLMDGYVSIGYAVYAILLAEIFGMSDLLTFLGLVVGAIGRFIGATLLSNYIGDALGRKKMLTYSILGFSISAAFISLLPSASVLSTYGISPIFSIILLFIVLFIVGFFAGAEYSGGASLSLESVKEKYRAPVGSFVQSGYGVGYFLLLLVGEEMQTFMGTSAFDNYGWRILFATSLIPGLLTLIIRHYSRETPIFEEIKLSDEIEKTPALNAISKNPGIFGAILLISGLLLANTVTLSFYPTFLPSMFSNLSKPVNNYYNEIINLISLIGVWVGGFLTFYIVRRKLSISIFFIVFVIVSIITEMILLYFNTLMNDVYAFSIQSLAEAAIFAAIPAYLTEIFHKGHRTSGVGFVYNLGGIPAAFGISAIIFYNDFIYKGNTHGFIISWFVIIIISIVTMGAGILLSRETFSTKIDPIKV
ncbi:MFS transporter [Caldiplasma sukawensis]